MCARMYGRKDIFRKNNWGREIDPGGLVHVNTEKGQYPGLWGGVPAPGEKVQGYDLFARRESINNWLVKGWKLVDLASIGSFDERNTVQKNGEFVEFAITDGLVVRGLAKVQELSNGKKVLHVKVITEEASSVVKTVHHRMPMIRETKF